MANKDYTYGIARIRYREKSCLNNQFILSLCAAQSEKEALRLLADKGWAQSGEDSLQVIANQRKELASFMKEILGENQEFEVFFMENDFHNLKAAIKKALYPTTGKVYLEGGKISPKAMEKALSENDFSALPQMVQACAKEAFLTLKETCDGQSCDIIIDRALVEAQLEAAGKTDTKILQTYAKHQSAVVNIKIAYRAIKTGKGKEFLEKALIEGGALNKSELIKSAVAKGLEGIFEYLSKTQYASLGESLKKGGAQFERECDNILIRLIKPYKSEYFKIDAPVAYYLGRLNEIKTVQIILTAKANGLGKEYIEERLREMYV